MDALLMIGSKDLPSERGKIFERRNPLTGEVATRAAAATTRDAVRAADAAAEAFERWSGTGPNARRSLLNRAADLLIERASLLIAAMAEETGAAAAWAGFNVELASRMIREAASMTTQIKGEVIPSDKPGLWSMAIREPAGVILGIAPWNAPIILGVRAVVMPLACGNTVVLKASEMCPRIHCLIGQVFRDAGLTDGIINVVTNDAADAAQIVETLIDHPAVKRINFTGSTRVGRIIAQHAARHPKPVLLELGGKSPLIVLEDADLDEAVRAAAFGAFMHQGQICMSTERIVVVDEVADSFVAKLCAKAATLRAGDPRENRAPLGALVDPANVAHVNRMIDDAVEKGATKAAGGDSSGVLMSACVVDRVTADMSLYSDESFGPVVAVIRARDQEHAIQIANDTQYGLSSAVFSRDIARALKVAKRIHSGICHINGPTVQDEAQMPFGGMNASGYGRFGGQAGVSEFTELRWITIATEPGHFPI
jgi:acyl-CoA reductase-like NAD-dependent aldehyde dehydrogenase